MKCSKVDEGIVHLSEGLYNVMFEGELSLISSMFCHEEGVIVSGFGKIGSAWKN